MLAQSRLVHAQSQWTNLRSAPISKGAYALHSLPLNDEARSGRRDLNPQPQPWQGYALPLSYFRQLRRLLLFYDNPSSSSTSPLGTSRFLSLSPLGWRLPATRAIKREIVPKATTCVFLGYAPSGYRCYDVKSKRRDSMPASSADCQPVQVTSEDSSHPAQHVYSRRRLHYVSQAKTTPEDQQSSPVASPPVASSDSGSLSQVRRSSQVSYPVEGFLSYLMNRFPQNIELTSWFHCSRADSSMFVRRRHGRCLILLLYVDDNILTGNDSSLLFDFIKELGNQFVSFIRCITFSTWRYLAPPLDFA
ncbi:hypothetical protein FEM48_ZijujMtG0001000 (mitochondrion) [Ziziphus jujuba var. spinosa]|uniref:Reverse transcriptase Ty1/copia-type domain-containing protein n=1 Tax=Ziziphus jujuba var. spinosa TaxID=714518 RepID=A0A978UA62_ZIZJJ|nr:hypothetical protein FEM48_ZijujMtG0001000 [Ziziphus jujuba var. spinosa]